MLSPTTYLPEIKTLDEYPPEKLLGYVKYLRNLYSPPVRGSRRRRSLETSHRIPPIQDDPFEHNYAVKWLTALISRCGGFYTDVLPGGQIAQEELLDSAAALLAVCAGTAAAGIIMRTFIFDTEARDSPSSFPLSSFSIHLTDVPLDNHDYGSVGAQTWGGACVLADMIVEAPTLFGIPQTISSESMPFRCLELGAGTGLVSLTVGKIIQSKLAAVPSGLLEELGRLDVVATDYYPSVLANMDANIKANFLASTSNALHIESQALDWAQFSSQEHFPETITLQFPFDVVFGADIIYEDQHAEWIKACLRKLLKKPTHMPREPTFHLIIPLRQTHQAESNTIERVFCREKSEPSIRRPKAGGGELVIKHRETVLCDADTGNTNEQVEYLYYRIGWEI